MHLSLSSPFFSAYNVCRHLICQFRKYLLLIKENESNFFSLNFFVLFVINGSIHDNLEKQQFDRAISLRLSHYESRMPKKRIHSM